MEIQIMRIGAGFDLPLPSYETAGSVGCDLRAALDSNLIPVEPNRMVMIGTGIAVAIPEGFEGQVRPRSGMSKKGLLFQNTIGTIDADYRGEIKVMLRNILPNRPWVIRHGDRIAQLVIAPVVIAKWKEVHKLPETKRGAGGFGSSGVW